MLGDLMNSYEDDLMQFFANDIAAGNIVVLPDSTEYFMKLAAKFPFQGSKIDWEALPGSIEQMERRPRFQMEAFVHFFCNITTDCNLEGDIVYMGDSVTDFALKSRKEIFENFLRKIFEVPQHHYFVAVDFSWCMVFTFEGDMSFSRAPSNNKGQTTND